ncbi:hypothetical protein B0H14DRAFT_3660281 [Mycena olivaceomarginata]|nr:hypothetical protein B0H14DRAFT_3660281 [Mycena olivaceomarginata]
MAMARAVLKGEQTRTGKVSKADADRLTEQLIRWAVGLPPFHQHTYSLAADSPLDHWKGLLRDSNADVLALCDERTVSLMGWINAARRSSMTSEHLIACAQLAQWFKFRLTEGNYNGRNIGPETVDQDAVEKALFDQPVLYDLAETDRVDTTVSAETTSEAGVHRSSTLWAAARATGTPEMEDWDLED